ncbi:uncharacterized protein LOC8279810 [Ricinus communis]|uniref:uncharacterized protein LOC8279810 n=1 Tax=Ricinus communis TaxID=3988 RepID=UPI0007727E6D|nr:uncharacterized protein LOC8279810 [Ricinus communis]|eukprot:XP_015575494.1 uncharacterized protein LOC8279810 [Ricinus communis]
MMAVDLHSRDSLWIPSQFFNEENNNNTNAPSVNSSSNNSKPVSQNWSSCFSNCSDFGSAFSSPVESEFGSTESDSDQEDDYTAELTRQMAHYMLQDDEDRHEEKAWSQEEVSITGKFENLKNNEEKLEYNSRERFLATSLEPTSASLSMKKPKCQSLEFQSRQALIDYQIRAIQLYKLKQEEIMKQKQECLYQGQQGNGYKQIELNKQQVKQFHQNKGRACSGFGNGQKVSSWVNLQQKQRTGSEMTAVFLGEPGSRSGSSCGTGVFLPRGISNTCESRKKPGCSTVLIPARVVQALKLHFDKMGIESRPNGASFPVQLQQHDGVMVDVRYGLQMKKRNQSKDVQSMNNHQEMGLPQEWTY